MILADARALAKRLAAAHKSSDFYGVLRSHRGYSMLVATDVTIQTVINWFTDEGMSVTRFNRELGEAECWRVWFQETVNEKRA